MDSTLNKINANNGGCHTTKNDVLGGTLLNNNNKYK